LPLQFFGSTKEIAPKWQKMKEVYRENIQTSIVSGQSIAVYAYPTSTGL
jgi:hypothetical protein